jgi:hypothetical protein
VERWSNLLVNHANPGRYIIYIIWVARQIRVKKRKSQRAFAKATAKMSAAHRAETTVHQAPGKHWWLARPWPGSYSSCSHGSSNLVVLSLRLCVLVQQLVAFVQFLFLHVYHNDSQCICYWILALTNQLNTSHIFSFFSAYSQSTVCLLNSLAFNCHSVMSGIKLSNVKSMG